ncbi:squalene epoxidase-domain-containing protein [Mycena albidolilacea]|uniref:Squalene monooxygenase n=1 Tax=Mycena albidolilacea TaxID=1033008 RepID=A0AAD7AHE7_9AGAR|nr:squalene epoxidase-domain-containing protein [Mycena albidolilacea]
MWSTHYDVLIVGAGVAGSALAHALSTLPREKPLRIALLERSLTESDQIVGELIQPGGVSALEELGLASCLENTDPTHVKGYCMLSGDRTVEIPYPAAAEGRSFDHGRFITNMRDAARTSVGVDLIEATVTDLIHAHFERKIIGVHAVQTGRVTSGEDGNKATFLADLVIVADGCFSNFRSSVMGQAAGKPLTRSHCVGVILEDAPLPLQEHSTIVSVQGSGPVLLYQISKHHTQMLIDIQHPAPSDLKSHLLTKIVPQLPIPLRCAAEIAITKGHLRKMPSASLPAVQQGTSSSGGILLGDAWNMRHPLTSGGTTVALNDVLILRSLLGALPDFKDRAQINRVVRQWHWRRKLVSSTVNILSAALYDVLTGKDADLAVLRTGYVKYLERGGECLSGPASLLSIVTPSPMQLIWHFLALTFFSIWVLFTHARATPGLNGKPRYVAPSFDEYPALLRRSVHVLHTACLIFVPLAWTEIRWWAPSRRKASAKPPPRVPLAATESVTLPVYLAMFTAPMVLWMACLLVFR